MSKAAATALPGLCRDCLAEGIEAPRCAACGSPRLLRHPELDDLSVAHIDCDAFYAAVEKRDRPELADRPVIIGGAKRGVVSTACYIARIDGVHSAMPMFKALKACPDAVVIRPDMAKYVAVGRQVRSLMQALTPLVEPLSIDEAFLDLSGTEMVHGMTPARTLARFARRIEQEIGITVSVGLSHNKFLAKIASDRDKPRGFCVIGRAETEDFLARQPVGVIWGVGAALQRRLARDDVRLLADLRRIGETALVARYGAIGQRLHGLAWGRDERAVSPTRAAKSISSETTFESDIAEAGILDAKLWRQCERVSRRAKAAGLAGGTAVLKLKTAGFRTLTRSRRLAHPTQLADGLYRALAPLLAEAADGTAFRLIGAGMADLCPSGPAAADDLFAADDTRRALAEAAMDRVRARFGSEAVGKGRGLKDGASPR